MNTETKPHIELTDVSSMTRNDVVPYYADILINGATNEEVVRINQLILSKWTRAGLTYIKEAAWKIRRAVTGDPT